MARGLLTTAHLESWHDELNASCFDYQLPKCTFVIGVYRGPEKMGPYEACYYANYDGSGTIFIHPSNTGDLRFAKECLAHEMIHQWQDLCRLRLDHRAVFHAWCHHITQITGLVP